MYNPPDHYVMPSLPSGSTHDIRGIPREFNHEYSTTVCAAHIIVRNLILSNFQTFVNCSEVV